MGVNNSVALNSVIGLINYAILSLGYFCSKMIFHLNKRVIISEVEKQGRCRILIQFKPNIILCDSEPNINPGIMWI